MEAIKRKRKTAKTQVTKLESYLEKIIQSGYTNADLESITVRLERLEHYEKMFYENQNKLEEMEPDESDKDSDGNVLNREAFEEQYIKVKAGFRKAMAALKPAAAATAVSDNQLENSLIALSNNQNSMATLVESLVNNRLSETAPTGTNIKLPSINLPTFTGNMLDWIAFRDLFKALVHDNVKLSSVQKLQYLKNSLKGDALSVIKHLTTTEANYNAAWDNLHTRYDKEKLIIESHIRVIMEQSALAQTSLSALNRLYNIIMESVQSLKALKAPVEYWDYWLNFVVVSKLDSESKQLWARQTANNDKPTFAELTSFLQERLYELESTQTVARNSPNNRSKKVYTIAIQKCPKCIKSHGLNKCPAFKALSLLERKAFVQKSGLCYICLSNAHIARQCTASLCAICGRRHNELLHYYGHYSDNNKENNSGSTAMVSEETKLSGEQKTINIHLAAQQEHQVLLPTAVVLIQDCYGTMQPFRALLDSGSQTTLITERCIQNLGLKRTNSKYVISGVSPNVSSLKYSKGEAVLDIGSKITKKVYKVSALIVNEITCKLPTQTIDVDGHAAYKNIELADPKFYQRSRIDLLLGADIVLNSLQDGEILSGGLLARNTSFGWIIGGRVGETSPKALVHVSVIDVDKSLRKFWEIEESLVRNESKSDEIDPAETHYQQTHRRLENGRYMVRLPFHKDCDNLKTTRNAAADRLNSIEKRFERNPEIKRDYCVFMREYLALGHMKEVSQPKVLRNGGQSCYLPHHPVIRPEKTTTKLRVVFDASLKTDTGSSLNDTLLVGPVIQPDLVDLLIKFRLHRIGLCADITKMYRQILMHPEDCCFQTILWRFDPKNEVKEYELLTVTYGTSPASFLATRTLKQLSLDEGDNFPETRELLINNFYMDDLIAGADSVEEADVITRSITSLLLKGGFELRKWVSNSSKIMQNLSIEDKPNIVAFSEAEDTFVKTLGLYWKPQEDVFSFKVKLNKNYADTKREMLSEISRIFDPLGLLAPVIINAKIMFQGLWLYNVEWDSILPGPILTSWLKLRRELVDIEIIEVPRCISIKGERLELYGFSDASEKAYAAVVYLKASSSDQEVKVNIIQSKTKVAPLRQISVPRLELCAAHLLAKLMFKLCKILNINEGNCLMFTDSMTVLKWLSDNPRKWTTFVANRVADIHYLLPDVKWRYVSSKENPADCASRGITVSALKEHDLWWHGPELILKNKELLNFNFVEDNLEVPETRRIVAACTVLQEHDVFLKLLEKCSSYRRLKRITAFCFRFVQNLRLKRKDRKIGPLSVNELNEALQFWIIRTQHINFAEEIRTCSKNKSIARNSKLISLNPFLDKNGILRVGGRLSNSELQYDQKHPVILCASDRFTQIIVMEAHTKYFHAGLQLLQTILNQKYHIINARKLIKQLILKCVKCVRYRTTVQRQQMGNLPKCRTEIGRAFLHVGLDYAGPFLVRPWRGRGNKRFKAYAALFVCMSTKSVHLELVTDLSTDAFIAAFKRFSSRRGLCKTLYSDNATNFVGASRILDELQKFIRSNSFQNNVITYLQDNGIEWRFIPPLSPNFGGIWEAAVKSMKYHLKREVGNMSLTFEEMCTLLCQVEAVLNSRPLCPTDNENLEALTPAHFLVGGHLLSVPEADTTEINMNRLTRWKLVQRLHQNLWKRWLREYLVTLQQRSKWQKLSPNVKIGDLVIVSEDNTPPAHWPLARIVEVHPGSDGLVRVVTLRGQKGTYKRPIRKVILLPVETKEGEHEVHGGQNVPESESIDAVAWRA